jgi:hypothetical protein
MGFKSFPVSAGAFGVGLPMLAFVAGGFVAVTFVACEGVLLQGVL